MRLPPPKPGGHVRPPRVRGKSHGRIVPASRSARRTVSTRRRPCRPPGGANRGNPVQRDPGLRQEIEPLLDVYAAEEHQHELALQLWMLLLQKGSCGQIVKEAQIDAVGHEADGGPGSKAAKVANLGTRQRVQAGCLAEVPGLDEREVETLLPPLVPQGPWLGHAV